MPSADADIVSGQGTPTAPTLSAASMTSSQSGVLPASTRMRSPGSTPFSRRTVAHLAAPSAMRKNDRGSMTPSLPRYVRARRFGSRASTSTTSRVKLNRSGTAQRPSASAGTTAAASYDPFPMRAATRFRRRVSSFTASPLSTRKARKLKASNAASTSSLAPSQMAHLRGVRRGGGNHLLPRAPRCVCRAAGACRRGPTGS